MSEYYTVVPDFHQILAKDGKCLTLYKGFVNNYDTLHCTSEL